MLRATSRASGRGRGTRQIRSTSPACQGVTAEQQARAEQLVRDTLRDLPRSPTSPRSPALGYQSIGDAASRLRALHQLRAARRRQDARPDAHRSRSCSRSTATSARWSRRCSSSAARRSTIPSSSTTAGRLMQWHVHDNLCWGLDENGQPKVMAVLDVTGRRLPTADRSTPAATTRWCTCGSHPTSADRSPPSRVTVPARPTPPTAHATDQCGHDHAWRSPTDDVDHARPYDPTLPIDLAGVDGRHARAAGVRREPRRRHRSRPAAVVRPRRRRGRRLPLDRRRQHRPRALHPVGLDRRRRVARPRPSREPRVRTSARRLEEARVGDVHAAQRLSAGGRARLGRGADAVARPRRPVLHRRSRRAAGRRAQAGRRNVPGRRSSTSRCHR